MQRAFFILVVFSIAGCGGGTGKETAPVKGTVMLNGAPLPGAAAVTFERIGGGKMAIGYVEPDGSFSLKTYREGDGAIVGKHRASISPVLPFAADDAPEPVPTTKNAIPAKYRSPATSGWEFEVKPNTDNEFRLELTSK